MRFTIVLAAFAAVASATSETGIKMLHQLQVLEKNNQITEEGALHLQNVKEALVQCAAAGDCTKEASKLPHLASMIEAPQVVNLDAVEAYDNCLANHKGDGSTEMIEKCGPLFEKAFD